MREREMTMSKTTTTWQLRTMATACLPSSIIGWWGCWKLHLSFLPPLLLQLFLLIHGDITALQTSDTNAEEAQSACQSDYFRAKCANNDVIMITSAQYGRMAISKCVKENFGYLGCANDVLQIMDGYCSGKRECSVRILDENFMNVKPCHDDLKSYLEVKYVCVKVVSPSRQDCQQHRPIALTNLTGYLASLVSAETGCGTADAPWSITGLPGQRVNITLFDFSVESVRMTDAVVGGGQETGVALGGGGGTGGGSRICVVYATIREESGRRSVTICGGEARRKVVHVSLDNCIEIRMISSEPKTVSFLIHYEVIGCPSIEAPPGGWVKNNEEMAVFGCNQGPETWQMVCRGIEWTGDTGNCSIVSAQVELTTELNVDDVLELPWGLSLIIIVALAFSIWFIILTIGILCFKSQKTPETGSLYRSTAALNCGGGGGVDSMVVSCGGQSSLTGGGGGGVCPKQAGGAVIVCRLQPSQHRHHQNSPQATSNLLHIKEYDDGEHPSLFSPTVHSQPPPNYGALGPPKSLVRRWWPPVKGPIDDPVVRLTYPLCQSPYCLYSTPINERRRGSIYDPICQHHLLLHSRFFPPPPPPPPPPPSFPHHSASDPRITNQPDVVVTSPELDMIHCAAAADQGSALWGAVDQTQMKEVAPGLPCDVIEADKLAKAEDETWLTSHPDLN